MQRTEGRYNLNNMFVNGPPATTIEDDWLNSVQEEICTVVEESGLEVLDASNDTRNQLYEAITRIIGRVCALSSYYKNIKVANNAVNPNFQVDISFDELLVEDVYIDTPFSGTVDITVAGAGGLSEGVEANSTWYYIWFVCSADKVLQDLILDVSPTDPTLPAWYTKKKFVSCVYNDVAGNFQNFRQEDDYYGYISGTHFGLCPINALFSAYPAFATVGCQAEIPELVTKVNVLALFVGTANAANVNQYGYVYVKGYVNDAWTDVQVYCGNRGYSGNIAIRTHIHPESSWVETHNRSLQYSVNKANFGGTGTATVCIVGFEVPL